ncbi:cytochrome P450 [Coniophora puteana RWD-64-598 SS2]|uniref:Cytochrome P450 n=1 Tax=Coniophora puteana (strain RWD-64-598) TaxID=741705 RepID=A0A5M3MC72_CONPW|nr:cytochrome P450 [Coniophora puteana RWD-64-598 SS2]EIW76504.1 cytochrome P450 [Coniophora puteana RWD-64-598 SS2]
MNLSPLDIAALSVAAYIVGHLVTRSFRRAVDLSGPPRDSFLLGSRKALNDAPDAAVLFEQWAREYGPAYRVSMPLGADAVVLMDPKALAHFFSKETVTYVATPLGKFFTENLIGKGSLLVASGDVHKRQRKLLTPGFSTAAIRKLTEVFYDSAYKAKTAWDNLIESNPDGSIIEVQQWMNNISLDTVGIAGFSHDFGTLQGQQADVADVFHSLGHAPAKPSLMRMLIFNLAPHIPWLFKIPSKRSSILTKLNESMGQISEMLLSRTREQKAEGEEDKSVIGLLIKAENSDSSLYMSQEEVMAQMKLLIIAGYETTSISMTWALIELAQRPDIQTKLRDELSAFGSDPTYDQFTSGLLYLDAVVNEILRLHPPLSELSRQAAEADIIPLSTPTRTASGGLTSFVGVHKGTRMLIPIRAINRLTSLWGPDAAEFRPSRWLSSSIPGEGKEGGIPESARAVQGYKNMLTFSDGPKTCLGRTFAVTEFKTVLSVLIRNFTFELRDGPKSNLKFETTPGLLPRPKLEGESGTTVPLRVRRAD